MVASRYEPRSNSSYTDFDLQLGVEGNWTISLLTGSWSALKSTLPSLTQTRHKMISLRWHCDGSAHVEASTDTNIHSCGNLVSITLSFTFHDIMSQVAFILFTHLFLGVCATFAVIAEQKQNHQPSNRLTARSSTRPTEFKWSAAVCEYLWTGLFPQRYMMPKDQS